MSDNRNLFCCHQIRMNQKAKLTHVFQLRNGPYQFRKLSKTDVSHQMRVRNATVFLSLIRMNIGTQCQMMVIWHTSCVIIKIWRNLDHCMSRASAAGSRFLFVGYWYIWNRMKITGMADGAEWRTLQGSWRCRILREAQEAMRPCQCLVETRV